MRYIKVLLLVILFFLVMMFFVQNQSAFSQAVALKLDLLFLPPVESAPLPFYTLLIICFVLGALCIHADVGPGFPVRQADDGQHACPRL